MNFPFAAKWSFLHHYIDFSCSKKSTMTNRITSLRLHLKVRLLVATRQRGANRFAPGLTCFHHLLATSMMAFEDLVHLRYGFPKLAYITGFTEAGVGPSWCRVTYPYCNVVGSGKPRYEYRGFEANTRVAHVFHVQYTRHSTPSCMHAL